MLKNHRENAAELRCQIVDIVRKEAAARALKIAEEGQAHWIIHRSKERIIDAYRKILDECRLILVKYNLGIESGFLTLSDSFALDQKPLIENNNEESCSNKAQNFPPCLSGRARLSSEHIDPACPDSLENLPRGAPGQQPYYGNQGQIDGVDYEAQWAEGG